MLDFQTRNRLAQATLRRASIAYKAALTRHTREQIAGRSDMSVQQTRRMYLAAESLRRAGFRLTTAQREAGVR
jgi:hypothetical protein